VIAAAAMDQRGSLQKSLAKERGSAATGKDLEDFKTLVTDVLCKHASAILLDRSMGCRRRKHRHGKGLLLAYEKTGYDAQTPGRLPDLLDVWSVRRLKEGGRTASRSCSLATLPFERAGEQPEAGVDRAHRRRVPGARHPFFPGGLWMRERRQGGRREELWRMRRSRRSSGASMAGFGKRTLQRWMC